LNVERQGNDIRKGLEKLNHEFHLFSEIRGRGLMIGAVLEAAYKGRAGEILDIAAAHGLLILQAGPDVLRIVPPLTITDEEVAEGLERLHDSLSEFSKEAQVA
ncbi:MAG TPA: aminotransferase class III-fold pyridoxal phosphate-dependent enzyme, partial [Luteibacter sp.]|nr:aminotransferase class III-fold pyridoxal phosphate-dependent enzyme [Luteibacter sp.]